MGDRRGILPSVCPQTPSTLRKSVINKRNFISQSNMGRPILLLLSSLHISSAFIVRAGLCPEYVRGMANFDKNAYLGQWYEYSNVFEFYEDLPFGGKCVRATYTDEGDEVGVLNEFVSEVTGYGNIKGSARFANPSSGRGELIVGFGPFGRKKRALFGDRNRANYLVVKTDYTSYSVVYNCNPVGAILKKESLWLLTREQLPSQATINAGYQVMKNYNLPKGHLVGTEQTGCSLLPGSSTK